MSKEIFNIVHAKKGQNDKTYWTKCGICVAQNLGQADQKLSIHLDCLPVGEGFDGWLSIFPKNDDDRPRRSNASPHDDGNYDDIPFD